MEIEQVYKQFEFSQWEEEIEHLFPQWNISLFEFIQAIIAGEGLIYFKQMGYSLLDTLANELSGMKGVFVTLLLIGILSAIFSSMSGLFESQHMAVYGFYYNYLILIIFLMKISTQVFIITKQMLENMVIFMKMLLPTYFLTVAAAGGSVSALGFYQIFMIAICLVEMLLASVIVPLVGVYMMISVINGIWEEEKLVLLMGLLQKGIKGSLKLLITLVTGTGLLQSMITPVIDSAKMSIFQKSISALPGLGELAGGASQALLGCAVLIKNAAGIILFLLLFMSCAVPMCKLFLIMALLKGAAAIMGIVADKRISNCTNRMGEGVLLLFQTSLTAVTFFVIMISIVAFTTNRGL